VGNRYTVARYPRGCPQLRVPVTSAELADLDRRAAACGLSRAEYARAILWTDDQQPTEGDKNGNTLVLAPRRAPHARGRNG
jgi:hypothetical protein